MKVLVLVADYPRADGSVALMFVHVRNKYYRQKGMEVIVLNFASDHDYIIDGISVITLSSYQKQNEKYDVLISHAANIRNHYRFLKKYEKRFSKLLFFYHGHEVLSINKEYPKPYFFDKQSSTLRVKFQDIYDFIKLRLWKDYLPKLAHKSQFIFVSNWIYEKFLEYTRINPTSIKDHVLIINNSVGKEFEIENYNYKSEKEFDFITIRSNMDGSKYGVDIVNKLAYNNPDLKFLLVGKGKFFDFVPMAPNLTWLNKSLQHEEMIRLLNNSKCGLLLTREDTQGVMTCEMATFGMPVITSDIDVCHEIFHDLENVTLIGNDNTNLCLKDILTKLKSKEPYVKNERYFAKNTMEIEFGILNKLSG